MPDLPPNILSVERISNIYEPEAGKGRVLLNPDEEDNSILNEASGVHTDAVLRAYCVIEFKGPSDGSPDNVLIDGVRPLQVDKPHIRKWRFVGLTGEQGEFGCGISCKDLCGPGWQMEGIILMADGSLANGSLSTPNSGSRVSTYSTTNPCVDWIIKVEDLILDIYMIVNDTFCGQAFHLKFTKGSTLEKLRPVISFHEETRKVAFFDYDVTTLSEALSLPSEPRLPSDCSWVPLSESFKGVEFPPQDSIILEATPRGCSLRVFNTLKSPASFEADGSIQCVGPVTASRMSPPPPFDHTEKVMTQMLETMTAWSITEDEHQLQIHCGNGDVRTFCVNRAFMHPAIENPFADV